MGKYNGQITPPKVFRQFLGKLAACALIPGVGFMAAGKRRLGWGFLTLILLGLVLALTFVIRGGTSALIGIGSDPTKLGVVGFLLLVVAAVWLMSALAGLYHLEPSGLRPRQRLFSALVLVMVVSVAIAPLSVASRYAFTQRDLIQSVFVDEETQHSLTIPEDATDSDPWAGRKRVNVLILGSDSGPNREGSRTDTIMVASIDTKTGETVLFSLPRNLQEVPLPKGPMKKAYRRGYKGEPEEEYWLSSAYRNIPEEFPEVFEDIKEPGAEAMKLIVGEILDLKIDYYIMVNLRGFQYMVDALGGVELDVPYRIPIGTKNAPGGGCTRATGWIEKGKNQKLDGYHALWFARARCGPGPVSDDYERMRRQRCVIGALTQQANPVKLLTRYRQLASATEETVSTDISRARLRAFADLGTKVQKRGMRSLPFTNDIVDYYDPDYRKIRDFVEEALESDPDSKPKKKGAESKSHTSQDEETRANHDDSDGGDSNSGEDNERSNKDDRSSEGNGPREEDSSTEEEEPRESEGAQSIDDVC